MAFDLASFIGGLAAGGLCGALLMQLHKLDIIAELQDRVGDGLRQLEKLKGRGVGEAREPSEEERQLQQLFERLQEEIRRMYVKR